MNNIETAFIVEYREQIERAQQKLRCLNPGDKLLNYVKFGVKKPIGEPLPAVDIGQRFIYSYFSFDARQVIVSSFDFDARFFKYSKSGVKSFDEINGDEKFEMLENYLSDLEKKIKKLKK